MFFVRKKDCVVHFNDVGDAEYAFEVKNHTIFKLARFGDCKKFVLPTLKDIDPQCRSINCEDFCLPDPQNFSFLPLQKDSDLEKEFLRYIDGEIEVKKAVFSQASGAEITVPDANSYMLWLGHLDGKTSLTVKVPANFQIFNYVQLSQKLEVVKGESQLCARAIVSDFEKTAMQNRRSIFPYYNCQPQKSKTKIVYYFPDKIER